MKEITGGMKAILYMSGEAIAVVLTDNIEARSRESVRSQLQDIEDHYKINPANKGKHFTVKIREGRLFK